MENKKPKYSVLARATQADVVMEPFPHLVLADAIDEGLCARLLDEAPPLDAFTHRSDFWRDDDPEEAWGDPPDNLRLNIKLKHLQSGAPVSDLWREFALAHATPEFFADVVRVLGDGIRRVYPHLAGGLAGMSVGRHGIDSADRVDIRLGASITANTPVRGRPSRLRGAHVDQPNELFNSLLYLRDPGDTSDGGELELYRFTGKRRFRDTEAADDAVEKVATVPYRSNVLVMFVNSIESLHGVSPRSVTPFPRRMFLAMGYMGENLFDLSPYQDADKDEIIQ